MPPRSSNAAPKQSGGSKRQSGQNRLRAAGFTSAETAPAEGKKTKETMEPVEPPVEKDAISESIDQSSLATADDTMEGVCAPSASPKDSQADVFSSPMSNDLSGNDQILNQKCTETAAIVKTDHEDQVKSTGEPNTAAISECTEIAPGKSADHEDQVTSTGEACGAPEKSTEHEDQVKSTGSTDVAVVKSTEHEDQIKASEDSTTGQEDTEITPVKRTDQEDQGNSRGEPEIAMISAEEPSSNNAVSASFKIDQPLLFPADAENADPILSEIPSGRVKGRKRAAIKRFFRRSLFCFA